MGLGKKLLIGAVLVLGGGGFGAYKFVFGQQLTESQVTSYIKAYKRVSKELPDVAKQLQTGGMESMVSGGPVDRIDAIAKESGLSGGFAEFLKVNTKVGMAFSKLQAETFMRTMAQTQGKGQAQIDEALANPDLPAETRAQLEAAKKQLSSASGGNPEAASMALKVVDLVVNEDEIALVGKYQAEILRAYTGH